MQHAPPGLRIAGGADFSDRPREKNSAVAQRTLVAVDHGADAAKRTLFPINYGAPPHPTLFAINKKMKVQRCRARQLQATNEARHGALASEQELERTLVGRKVVEKTRQRSAAQNLPNMSRNTLRQEASSSIIAVSLKKRRQWRQLGAQTPNRAKPKLREAGQEPRRGKPPLPARRYCWNPRERRGA